MRNSILAAVLAAAMACAVGARAETPGVTNSEIKIGNTVPYSGPVSSKGLTGRVIEAYFAMVNEKGGINGRKLKLYSLDDAFSPAEDRGSGVRRLVEGEEVALMFATFGTAQNVAIAKYLNTKKVPQLFLVSNSIQWDDPKGKPWSLPCLGAAPLRGGRHRRRVCPQEKPRGAVRRAVPERRRGEGISKGGTRRPRSGCGPSPPFVAIVQRDRSDDRLSSRHLGQHEGGRLPDSQPDFAGLRPGAVESEQSRMEAAALPGQRLREHSGSHGTGGPGRVDGRVGFGIRQALGSESE